ncbi:MAG: lysophospholipid acyltransferase family protein [Acutalibacteraceae bacterium]|nr:lysophospholipid acyltransferase family protein [Acutalibacteraceae bacterium]
MHNNKWIKLRHKFFRNFLILFLYPYTVLKYGIRINKFKEQENRPYLILYNHQTAFDQFFVGMSIKGPVYYLASEDIFSLGFVSSIIKFLVEPIPIKKQTLDIGAIKSCIKVVKEGGTLAIAPEGNRTFSGKTEYINPAIASLVKKLNVPVLLYRIEGGYGIHPRWSDVVRKGRMTAGVYDVINPEEYENLSKEELFNRIYRGLYVNEANSANIYKHKRRAEFLERAIYICPNCDFSTFYSNNNALECKKCKRKILYNEDTSLVGDGFKLPFPYISQWYDYQKEFVNNTDLKPYFSSAIYNEKISLYRVIPCKKKLKLKKDTDISLYGNRIVINKSQDDEIVFKFDEISALTILGKNKLDIYFENNIYQLKGDKRFNALKYVHIFNRYKNTCLEDKNGKFLGL